MTINPMTINTADAVRMRSELLGKINDSVHELNEQFILNPQELNTKTLRTLIGQLVETNRFLESQKQGLHDTWWTKHGDKMSLLFLGVMGLGGVLLTVTNIFQFTPSVFNTGTAQNCTSATTRVITSPNVSRTQILWAVIALLVNTVACKVFGNNCIIKRTLGQTNIFESQALQAITALIVLGIICQIAGGIGSVISDRKDKRELEIRQNLDSVMQMKQVGEEYLDRILAALEDYKNKPPEERDPEQIRKCIKEMKKMPKTGLARIKKEHVIPHMIEGLPDTNPLFVNYANLKRSTLRASKKETIGDVEAVFIRDETSPTESLDSSSMEGEQATAAQSMPAMLNFKAKRVLSPNQTFRKMWKNMESELGTKLKKIRIGEQYFNKEGIVIDREPISRSRSISETSFGNIPAEFETNVADLRIQMGDMVEMK